MAAAASPRQKRTVYKGELTGIRTLTQDGRAIGCTATIARVIKGEAVTSPITVTGEAFARVGHMFTPGPAAFYGVVEADGFTVIGPDLRRKTLQEAQAEAYRPRRAYRSPARIARDRFFAARARARRAETA